MSTTEPTGEDLRDEGVAAVLDADEAVHRGHRKVIEEAIDVLAESGETFTADDVQSALDDETRLRAAPNLIGALFNHYRNAGRIERVGWTTSTRTARHAGVLRQWTGTTATRTSS